MSADSAVGRADAPLQAAVTGVQRLRRGVAVASLLLACAPGLALAQDDPPPVHITWPALTLVDGSTLAPDAWAGTAAVVVFWATWCAYCRRHNAHVDALHSLLQTRAASSQTPPPLRVLGVAIDGDAASVRRYLAAQGYRFPVVAGQAELRRQFSARRMVPLTCLVDAAGRLRQCIPGEMARDDVLGLASLSWAR